MTSFDRSSISLKRLAAPIPASLAASALGLVGLIIGLFVDPTRTYFGYLAAYYWAATTAVGVLIFLLIGHASKASWFVVIRRLTEAASDTLPLFALLFIPLCFGLSRIYPWARPLDAMDEAMRHHVEHKRAWLNVPFFVVRAAVYFVIFVGVAGWLRRMSIRNDRVRSFALVERMRAVSGVTLIVVGFGVSFIGFDWSMSLQPGWYSTMFGFFTFAGAFAGAMGVTSMMVYFAATHGPLGGVLTPDHTHALGRLLLTSVIFWAYISFGQLVIIWMGDIPEESAFYAARTRGSWTGINYLLVFGHFIGPFLILLLRDVKRHPSQLAALGAWVLGAHYVDVYWQILPTCDAAGVRPHWVDLSGLLFVGGLATAVALWRYRAAAAIPPHDPELGAALRYEAAL